MAKELSPRETEIVEMAAEGFTNEVIADRLGLKIGTINTYWLRIKFKTGGFGRTDAVVRIFRKRFELALQEERVAWEGLSAILEKREILDVIAERARNAELRTHLAILQLVMDFTQTTAWATDADLTTHNITNGELPSFRSGVKWEGGKTLFEVFKTKDKAHPAIAAHLQALAGKKVIVPLSGEFDHMTLKVVPVLDDADKVVCCISILMACAK